MDLELRVAVARVEERLEAQDEREEYREAMLKVIIRDAVAEGVKPMSDKIAALERDVAKAKTYAAAVAFAAGASAWLLEHGSKLVPLLVAWLT